MGQQPHVVSPWTYTLVFVALLALTGVTVAVAAAPLGEWHAILALAIAAVKAALVILFFMHAWQSSRLIWVVILGSVVMLGILGLLTMIDYWTRGWMQYY